MYIHLETRAVPLPFDGTEVELVGDPEGLQHEQRYNLLEIYISQKYKYIYPSYKILIEITSPNRWHKYYISQVLLILLIKIIVLLILLKKIIMLVMLPKKL